MSQIHILDSHTADLIAAGEVVDRPASALKELVENAIDAGADAITAEIKNGGKTLMRVTDNGGGMSREDAPRCLLRHATSKISTAGDLERITTLGFRGEALAAICAASVVRIITKRREDTSGTAVLCDNGEITEVEEAAGMDGTSIIVTQLFAKLPARQKFLKTDMGEAGACSGVMEKIALSHPEISFRFISDGEDKLHTPGDGDLYNAIYTTLGRDYARSLTPVKSTASDGIEVTGYVSRPECPRKNRGGQHFFINGRTLRSRTLVAALEEAYSAYSESGTFPACVINIGINVHMVDVNVHPQKLEVKFSDERAVFNALYHAVRDTISSIKEKPVLEITEPVIKPEVVAPFVPTRERGEEREDSHALSSTVWECKLCVRPKGS
ncbi:MAG: DNA mismatch repair endonuclease MutL [Eubacteriales bacterium]